MNKQLAENLEKKLGISQEQIVREEYELIILKALFESKLGSAFVFKGGTALRLAYGSSRFSEDLDFSVVKKFDKDQLKKLLQTIANQNQALELKEALQKRYTYFALFKVKESFLNQSFSIKFEASIRPTKWKKDQQYQLQTLKSNVTSLTVLAQVSSLEQIKKEKVNIKPPRIRDFFDLWFINQRLGKTTELDFGKWKVNTVKRELHKFLPQGDRKLLEKWFLKNKKIKK